MIHLSTILYYVVFQNDTKLIRQKVFLSILHVNNLFFFLIYNVNN